MALSTGLINCKDEIIDMYVNKEMSAKKIAKEYNCCVNSIYYILKKYNIERRKETAIRKTVLFNEHYMDKIDTPEKAYILGILGADGNNYISQGVHKVYAVTLRLSIKDIDILQKIKELFEYKGEVRISRGRLDKETGKRYRETAGLYLCSKHLSLTLSDYGIVPNKTFKMQFPYWLPENLLPHYIRGLFDGDGSILIESRRKNLKVGYTGDYEFLTQLSEVLKQHGFTSSLGVKHRSKNGITGELRINNNQFVEEFLNWIYKDSTIHLDRKYERYHLFYHEHILPTKYCDDERYNQIKSFDN